MSTGIAMEQAVAEKQLIELRIEHRDLDEVIGRLAVELDSDEIQLRRLKKRKLALKDEIAQLESALVPNIIA
jgi:hypothetical protein